jgi:chaperone required for assembly of F1-ATPase
VRRFWKEVAVEECEGGYRITLDTRPIRTQGGTAQVLPTVALAEAMAEEWRAQGEEVDSKSFPLRDLADFAIDHAGNDRDKVITSLLAYAETDTLCYRADPDEPLFQRQRELWEPLVTACEARHGVRFERVSGIIHRKQPEATLERLREVLESKSAFELSALNMLASLASSLCIGLAALEPGSDPAALFAAANAEEDWQAELWGWDFAAEQARDTRLKAFELAARFAELAKP